MKPLSEVLERMPSTLLEQEPRQSLPPMPQPGSMSSDGLSTIPPLDYSSIGPREARALDILVLPEEPGPQRANGLKGNTLNKHELSVGEIKATLAKTLHRVCALQKQYGKTQAELETLVEGFYWALCEVKRFTLEQVLDAIGKYILSHSDIPSPADIVNLVKPPIPEWKPNWAYYVALKNKVRTEGYYLYSTEKKYLEACEKYARSSLEESVKDEFDNAQRKLISVDEVYE